MSQNKNVLLLIGSARPHRSTSETLGTYLMNRLREQGCETETLFAHKLLKANDWSPLLSATDRVGLVVIAFPLYIDSLPYTLTKALEKIAQHRLESPDNKIQNLVCIVNCGFPETHQNNTALDICRQFARETGFNWAGGLALGGGGAIDGRPLSGMTKKARNVIASLDLAADALPSGKQVPDEATEKMAKPIIAKWLYRLLGDMGWKRVAKKYNTHKALWDRPYQS